MREWSEEAGSPFQTAFEPQALLFSHFTSGCESKHPKLHGSPPGSSATVDLSSPEPESCSLLDPGQRRRSSHELWSAGVGASVHSEDDTGRKPFTSTLEKKHNRVSSVYCWWPESSRLVSGPREEVLGTS
ncbi:hypothetical protein INR49_019437 [Caranx melampygus]|nr:hypothetical protein INR49_019437 [Caranx melampygus]